MKKCILLFIILSSAKVFAQIPEDAIRYSWLSHTGTARYMAIGGVMGSLGGDVSAAYVNPAGLGFYRTGEVVFTPAYLQNKNKATFRGGDTEKFTNSKFNLGTVGFVKGFNFNNDPKSGHAFSIALTQTANFNNVIKYSGFNNFSSISEQFAEEFARSGLTIDEALNTDSRLPYTAAPALYTYLIDTVFDGSKYVVRSPSETIINAGQALKQDMLKTSSGGMYELAFSGAENRKDKWMIGATVGVPIIHYKSKTEFTETDTSSNKTNLFSTSTFTDDFETTGIGVNLKLGIIYRPREYIRLGLALHSPSFIYQSDERKTSIYNKREGSDSLRDEFASSALFTSDNVSINDKYIQTTPWKAIVSASYVFRETENVKRQKGFISADVEYVNYRSSRFNVEEETDENESLQSYYTALNNVLKEQYKGAFNFRVGGELKFNIIMARLGFAYYGSPYRESQLKANRMLLSGGLGYRHKGFFVDLTYVHNVSKDVNFPYRLQDKENTFASLNQTQGNISATFGVKF